VGFDFEMLKIYKSNGGREILKATEVEEKGIKRQRKFAFEVNGSSNTLKDE
jgi:hypothetical protein